jgi:hypothetical protein
MGRGKEAKGASGLGELGDEELGQVALLEERAGAGEVEWHLWERMKDEG